ncbi:MAG: hypothetical protein E7047_00885 [Lentisphaerae bacterium]|nr:hypothetical protein [Lentisphaerota bacterium]
MFSKNRIWVGIITLLCMAVTLAVMLWVNYVRDEAFVYTVGALLLGELMLGGSCMGLSKTEGRLFPLTLTHSVISTGYMIFAFIMLLPFALDASELSLRIWHLLGLLAAVVLHIVATMARGTVADFEGQQAAALNNRKQFTLEVAKFAQLKKEWLTTDRALAKKVNDLQEKARYAADTLPGMEEVDGNIMSALAKLNAAETPDAALACVEEAGNLLDFRRKMVTSLR